MIDLKKINSRKIYNIQEISEIFDLHYTSVMRWAYNGIKKPVANERIFMPFFKVGKKLRVKGSDLRIFLKRLD